jgi:hypothetical protein
VDGAISCSLPTGSPASPARTIAVNLQTGGIAERFEVGRGVIEFHDDLILVLLRCYTIILEYSKYKAALIDDQKIFR